MMMKPLAPLALTALFLSAAQAAPVQYEMNLHTYAGIGAGGAMGMIGSLFGSKGSSFSKSMDLRLTNPTDIADGYSADHTVPDAMKIGPSLPLKGERRPVGGDGSTEQGGEADGKIKIYWGCSETVAKGQPQIIDLKALSKSFSPEVLAMVQQARSRKGAAATETISLPPRTVWWPYGDSNFKGIPSDASAIGEHVVKASFIPQEIRYTITDALDFLAPLNLKAASTDTKQAVPLSWDSISRVKGYNLNAVGAAEKELVIWMAVRNKSPMLPASQTTCTIPAGIFEKTQVAMVSEEGVGPQQSFAYPPQKPGEKKPLIWTARVRVGTTDTALLGLQQAASGAAGDAAADAVVPGGGSAFKALKGLFGK